MKKFKGTPAPWEYEPDNGWECAVNTSKDSHYIEVSNTDMLESGSNEMYHNAKLIAAAPELLEALQVFVDFPMEDLNSYIDEGLPMTMTVQSSDIYRALNEKKKALD